MKKTVNSCRFYFARNNKLSFTYRVFVNFIKIKSPWDPRGRNVSTLTHKTDVHIFLSLCSNISKTPVKKYTSNMDFFFPVGVWARGSK